MLRRLQTFVCAQTDASNVQDHAHRMSAIPNRRCVQQSRARKMARVQVLTTFLWKSSKLVETRWCPFFVLFFTVFSS